MKLRCTHNSIRIRLRKSDLAILESEGTVRESIQFSLDASLEFSLIKGTHIETVRAVLSGSSISIELPELQAQKWIESNQVGIELNQDISQGESLHILLEKDFPCLDREEENKADTFWELAPDQPEVC